MSVSLRKITCESWDHLGCVLCVDTVKPVTLAKPNPVVRATRIFTTAGVARYSDVREHADGRVSLVTWRDTTGTGLRRTTVPVWMVSRYADVVDDIQHMECLFRTCGGVKTLL